MKNWSVPKKTENCPLGKVPKKTENCPLGKVPKKTENCPLGKVPKKTENCPLGKVPKKTENCRPLTTHHCLLSDAISKTIQVQFREKGITSRIIGVAKLAV